MKKFAIGLTTTLVIILGIGLTGGPSTLGRKLKDVKSEWVGIERIVKVYSRDGKLLTTYKGKHIDIEFFLTRVTFHLDDGRRVILRDTLLIVEEVKEKPVAKQGDGE